MLSCIERTYALIGWRWKSREIKNYENLKKKKKWRNNIDLIFPHMCLVERMKKWKDEKLYFLVEEKINKQPKRKRNHTQLKK